MYVDVTSFFLLIFSVVVLLYNPLCIHSLLYKKYCLKEKKLLFFQMLFLLLCMVKHDCFVKKEWREYREQNRIKIIIMNLSKGNRIGNLYRLNN